MRYLNELILKGGVKRVSLLLAISIDSDHKVFFFIIIIFNACRCISRVDLEESGGIVRIGFSTQYAIYIFYIRSIFAW